MSKPDILLDMDGTICDFLTASFRANNLNMVHDDVKRWDFCEPEILIRDYMAACDAVPDFWSNLDPYPWASELFELCQQFGNVVFATSPSINSDCLRQKVDWLRKHGFMASDQMKCMIGPLKHMMSMPGTILIDDYDVNVQKFRRGFGYAIAFPQRWNESRHAVGDRIGYVADQLDRLAWVASADASEIIYGSAGR